MAGINPLRDSSDRAADFLNETLAEIAPETGDGQPSEAVPEEVVPEVPPDPNAISIEEAQVEAPLIEQYEDRQKVRLLLFTKDESILQEGSVTHQRIADGRDFFLEIHVVLLNFKQEGTEPTIFRLFENVWAYTTNSSSWWKLSYDAYTIAEEQMVFSGGFRADIVVAEDLFEAGLPAYFLSKKYERPLQLHVHEDFYDPTYVESQDHPALYEWSVDFLLKRAQSVRTRSEFQKEAVIAEYPRLESTVELLPNYYNLNVWRDFTPTMSLRDQYPRFKFIMLHISSMRAPSHSSEVMEGAARILRRYPTVGLIMVGNGPLRSMLERQAIALGIQNQVEFRPMPTETISMMKSAHLLIHLSEDGNEDDVLLEAAVVKLPMVANAGGLAGTLFVDNDSACLCAPTDIECIAFKINHYLNENQDRARFALTASEIVFERIEQDYGAYLRAYAESIERGLVAGG